MSASAYTVSEISARSPDMAEREFAEFVEDIRANGQLVPIWVRGDEVIDGRKRLAACRRLGITPKVVNLDPSQDAEAVARALNVLRTHYSPSQRAIFAAERASVQHGGDRRSSSKNRTCPPSIRKAADEAGVHPSYVSKARDVAASAAPEVTAAIKAGRLTIHAASQIVEAVPDQREQPAIVKRVVEASVGKARHTPVAKVLEGVDPRRDRAMPNPKHEQFALAVQKLDVGAELIAKHADAVRNDVRRRDFLDTLRQVRTTISRTITVLENTL